MHDLVIADMERSNPMAPGLNAAVALIQERKQHGLDEYQTLLQAHNTRDARVDAVEEVADACVYLRQMLEEAVDEPRSIKIDILYTSMVFILQDLCLMGTPE
jgi:hypothetical protein